MQQSHIISEVNANKSYSSVAVITRINILAATGDRRAGNAARRTHQPQYQKEGPQNGFIRKTFFFQYNE